MLLQFELDSELYVVAATGSKKAIALDKNKQIFFILFSISVSSYNTESIPIKF